MTSTRVRAGTYILPAILLGLMGWWRWRVPLLAQDDGTAFVYPRLMDDGWVPWRDFAYLYGPLPLWLLRITYAAVGWTANGFRLAGLLMELGFVASIVATGRRLSGDVPALVGGLAAAVFIGFQEPRPSSTLLGLTFVLLATGSDGLRSGVLAGLAVATRPEMAVPAAMTLRRSGRWFVGAVVGALPLLWYVALAGPFAMLEGTVGNGFRSAPYRRVPIDSTNIAGVLLMLAGVGIVCTLWRTDWRVVAVVVLSLPWAFQRLDTYHMTPMLALAFGLVPAAIAVRGWPVVRYVVAVLVPIAVILPSIPEPATSVTVRYAGHEWRLSEPDPDLDAALDAATAAGGRLFVGPANLRRATYSPTFVYHLTGMEPTGPWLEFNPDNANASDSGLADQLAAADVAVLSSEWDWDDRTTEGSTEPEQVLHQRFHRVLSRGVWQVWVRSG